MKQLYYHLFWAFAKSRIRSNDNLEQINCLRKLLRKNPTWIKGHLLLASCALRAFEVDARENTARHLATAKLSAQAVKVLAGEDSDEQLEADAVVGMTQFYSKRYEASLVEFEKLLKTDKQVRLAKDTLVKVLECAGAAALALGDQERAEKYLSGVPEKNRSGQNEAALNYIEAKRSGKIQ